jgi:hypothetical protein
MTLEKALVPIPFTGAFDQKTSDKLIGNGKFLILQNAVRKKGGLFEKRQGFTALGKSYTSLEIVGSGSTTTKVSGTISHGLALSSFADQPVIFDGFNLYSYSPAAAKWRGAGFAPTCSLTTRPVARDGTNKTAADFAVNGTYSMAVWTNESIPVWAVYDDTTGACLSGVQGLGTIGATSPRVVAVTSGFCAVWTSGSVLYWAFVDLTDPTVLVSTGSGTPSLPPDTSRFLDVCSWTGTQVAFAYRAFAGTFNTVWGRLDKTGVLVSGFSGVEQAVCIGVAADQPNNRLYVYIGPTGANDMQARVVNGTTAASISTTTFGTRQGAGGYRNVAAINTAATNVLQVFSEEFGYTVTTNPYMGGSYVHSQTLYYDGSWHAANETYTFQVGMVSKAYFDGVHSYVVVTHDTQLQPSYFLLRDDNKIVTRFASNSAGGFWKRTTFNTSLPTWSGFIQAGLSSLVVDSTGAFATILQERVQTTLLGPEPPQETYTLYDLQRYGLKVATATNYTTASLNGLTYVAAGQVRVFDGVNIREAGTHYFPEQVTLTDAGVGAMSAGTYTVRATYEWWDSQGNRHESAPSTPVSCTIAVSHNLSVTVPLLSLGENVVAYNTVIWMAPAGTADVFYRLPPPPAGVISKAASPYAEVLYTTGGVLENIAPPHANVVHAYKNRIWLGGLEGNQLAFSKEAEAEVGLGFPDSFRIQISDEGGAVTAFATLDSNLIVFKKDRIFYLYGEGPNASGLQWDYPEPIRVQTELGTIYPNSIAEIDRGVIFKSAKGWCILSRDLKVSFLGAPAEDFASLVPTSTTVIGDRDEVRVTHSNGSCIVYNTYFDQWMEHTNYTATGGAYIGTAFYHLKSDGTVNVENAAYTDNGTKIDMAIETTWLSMSQLQGFQRVYKMFLLGDFVDDFHCTLSIAYDFNNTYTQVTNFSTVGKFTVPTFQLRLQPKTQKCQAIKLKIETIDDIGAGGANFKPTALSLEIGRKRGGYKLPNAVTV